MLGEIEKGNASGILAWNPDRLARNSIDGGRIIYLVDTGKIQRILPIDPPSLPRWKCEALSFGAPPAFEIKLPRNSFTPLDSKHLTGFTLAK